MTDNIKRTRGFALGRIFGAHIIVQPSTVLMLIVLALVFSSGPGLEVNRRTFAEGMLLAVLLFVSVFLHELAHAVTARMFRREVREIVITLWGGHTSFDARGLTPMISGATAAAGPAANLMIAGLVQAYLVLVGADGRIAWVLSWVVFANVLLAVFNALPGIPMDGGRVLESVVWAATGNHHKATIIAAWGGRVVALLVVIFAFAAPFATGGQPGVFEFVWAAIIFAVLWPAATGALKLSKLMRRREGLTGRTLMARAVTVPFDITVDQARNKALNAEAIEVIVLAADGTPAGHFPVALTDAVPADQRSSTPLQSVTMPLSRGAQVDGALHGDELIEHLKNWWGKTDVWIVEEEGQPVGVVKLDDMLKALQ